MKNPKVFIIVLHYKNWKDTNQCLDSLKNLNYDNYKVILVDNDKKNRGFAGGNNLGIRQALKEKADYVLLLNNDTMVDKDFLKELVRVGEKDEKIGILGPVIYEYGSNKIHFAGGKINWLYTKGTHLNNSKFKRAKPSQAYQNSKFIETDYITGACMLVKREVIEKISLMPEDYFLYFEDVDWCLKARRAGFKCMVVPTSSIWHKVSQSIKQASFSYIYYHFRNGLLLAKRNAPFFIKYLAYFVSFLIYLKQLIKSPNKWTKAIKLGIKDFYKGRFGNYEDWH